MATSKFKEEETAFTRGVHMSGHHESDCRFTEYTDYLYVPESSSNGTSSASRVDDKKTNSLVVLALFGLGRAGSIHFANIMANPRTRLAYVIDQDEEKCWWFRNKWNIVENDDGKDSIVFLQDPSRVYDDPSVDACLVATPTFAHEEIIIKSLRAGKAIFSEKPIAETIEQTKKCYKMSLEVGRPLFCAFNRRFDPSMAGVREQVRKGMVGHVQLIKTTSRDSPLPSLAFLRMSGGIFHDCAVHDLDMVTWVLGEYPNSVYAAANAQIGEIGDMGDFDNVVINMKFPSGTLACIDLSRYSSYGYDQRLEVFGPEGMIKVDNDSPNRIVASLAKSEQRCPIYHSFPSRYSVGYKRELNHFLDAVTGINKKLSVCGRATVAVSKIASACEKSARSGLPVELEWDQEELPEGYSFDL